MKADAGLTVRMKTPSSSRVIRRAAAAMLASGPAARASLRSCNGGKHMRLRCHRSRTGRRRDAHALSCTGEPRLKGGEVERCTRFRSGTSPCSASAHTLRCLTSARAGEAHEPFKHTRCAGRPGHPLHPPTQVHVKWNNSDTVWLEAVK